MVSDERERKKKMQREHSRKKFSEHTFAKNQDALLLSYLSARSLMAVSLRFVLRHQCSPEDEPSLQWWRVGLGPVRPAPLPREVPPLSYTVVPFC